MQHEDTAHPEHDVCSAHDPALQLGSCASPPDSGGSRDPGVRCRAGRKPRPRSLTCLVSPADASLTRDLRPPDVRRRGRANGRSLARRGSSPRRRLRARVEVAGSSRVSGSVPSSMPSPRLGLSGFGRQHRRRRARRGRGRAPTTSTRSRAGCAGRGAGAGRRRRSRRRRAPRRHRLRDPGARAPAPAAPSSRPTSPPAPTASPSSPTRATGATGTRSSRCTNCGPRFTIVTGLPYDRPATTMAGFPMCADCAARVRRPGRPALPRPAGRLPRLRPDGWPLVRPGRRDVHRRGRAARGTPAARRRARSSRSRGSAATTSPATPPTTPRSVALLRKRKRRGDKPFAVMVADADAAPTIAGRRRRRAAGCSPGTAGRSCCSPRRAGPARSRSPPRWRPATPTSA